MNNPNTYPAAVMVYGGAPSFDEPAAPNPFAVIADLRAGLDAAKRLRKHLPGDAPELQQADETIAALEAAIDAADIVPTPDPGGMIVAYHAAIEELATLRADNDARGVLIEELREEMTEAYEACDKMAAQRNGYMAERDQARAELDTMIARVVAAESSLSGNAAELSNVRSELDAVREELTAAKMSADLQRAANHRLRVDHDHNYDRWQQTLRALNAVVNATVVEP